MIHLTGVDVVLADRVVHGGTLTFDDGRIAAIEARRVPGGVDAEGLIAVPGFVDVHVHGVDGIDTLDDAAAVGALAARLPRFGVTAFCPTTVACAPDALAMVLGAVRAERAAAAPMHARVAGAHLESNFINPEYCGAQPRACLRLPPGPGGAAAPDAGGDYTAEALLDVIAAHRRETAIVTLAPELPGAVPLVRRLVAAGHRVSLGHSGATFEQAQAAVAAGARHATHLFNRMPPLGHRAPGLAGAVLALGDVLAEVICDGVHVHPSMVQLAVRAKGPDGVMAITDGTAGAGLPVGARARLGGRTIVVGEAAATLEDGTLAGSLLTMDGAFRLLVLRAGLSLVEAARLCATTPARALGLHDTGRLAPGLRADVVLLDRDLRLRQTWLGGVRLGT
jgi:N-acetylglucosamine-6-phosphate deacetylase